MHFRLVRYFTLTSLVAFIVVTVLLGYFYRQNAIDNMLLIEERNNVDLTRTFSNALWGEFEPFVNRAGEFSREELANAPRLAELHRQVVDLMRGNSVYKVKVFNLDGLTVYSSEKSQIGDDKSNNAGFLSARSGTPASELTHRDTFSAFENTVEDRDVLSSYVPIRDDQTGEIEGVFEIYTDVTAFLDEINRTQWLVVGGVVGLLLLLYLSLFFIVRRADQIIIQQGREREQAQQRIGQTDKMATIGQMVAGVAHQLNTPIAFTRSNVSLAKEMIDSLGTPVHLGRQLIDCIKHHDGDSVRLKVDNVRDQVRSYQDQDVDVNQLQEMLDESLNGLEQMRELVVNLRDFTRLDRAQVDHVDLNKGLDNVIYIAKSVIPNRVTIHKEFGDIPAIACMPSQINQVFLNLINNSAQAIEGSGSITVRTGVEGSYVRIEVADTGQGIPAEVLPHIFEPFCTTKEAGVGTGLGLSIAHDIVRNHGGRISVDSTAGQGTTFTILLPVDQSREQLKAA